MFVSVQCLRYQLNHEFEIRCIGKSSRAERSGNVFTQQATDITLLHLRWVKCVHQDAQSDTDFAISNHRAVKFLAPHVRYQACPCANFEPHATHNASPSTRGPFGAVGASKKGKPTATITCFRVADRLEVSKLQAPRANVGAGRRWIEKSIVEIPRRSESCTGSRCAMGARRQAFETVAELTSRVAFLTSINKAKTRGAAWRGRSAQLGLPSFDA